MKTQKTKGLDPIIYVLILMLVLSSLVACAPRNGDDGADAAPVPVLTQPATPLQCPNGGTQVTVGSSTYVSCNGIQGLQGDTGLAGADGQDGEDGIDGSDGQDGSDGVNGQNGSNGANGQNGTNGRDGLDAAGISVVDLCPGHTTYPTVFIEVALCLNNTLYGVYSANGGFLTMIPPGNYTSNAIGSACNLTVRANCVVTH